MNNSFAQFMNYYTSVMKKYAVFTGRAARKEYWMFVLTNLIVAIAVSIVAGIVKLDPLNGLYSLAVLVPSLAVGARRLHDTDRSAWWLLLCLIPIVGWIILLVFMLLDSQPGNNRFGANPKGVHSTPTSHTPPPQTPSTPAAPSTTV